MAASVRPALTGDAHSLRLTRDPGDALRGARRHVGVMVVFAIGVAARIVLLPLWHGQDFTVWTLASSASLRPIPEWPRATNRTAAGA